METTKVIYKGIEYDVKDPTIQEYLKIEDLATTESQKPYDWEIGQISYRGEHTSSQNLQNRLRKKEYIGDNIFSIETDDDYVFTVCVYDSREAATETDQWLGYLALDGFFVTNQTELAAHPATRSFWKTSDYHIKEGSVPPYRFRIMLRNSAQSDFTIDPTDTSKTLVSEATQHIHFQTITDTTLTRSGKIADAAAINDTITELERNMGCEIIRMNPNVYVYLRATSSSDGVSQIDLTNPFRYSSTYRAAIVPCSQGDKFYINVHATGGAGDARPWAILDAEGNILSRGQVVGGRLQTIKTITETNATYLVLNDRGGYSSCKILDDGAVQFIMQAAIDEASGASSTIGGWACTSGVINPYSNVDFSATNSFQRINSIAHSHPNTTALSNFTNAYNNNVRHFCSSRYYPSVPITPDYENKMFMTQGYIGDFHSFADAANIIISPNAEHIRSRLLKSDGTWANTSNIHILAPGSNFQSGIIYPNHPEGKSAFYPAKKYTEIMQGIIDNLKYTNGGGVIITHLNWTVNNTHFDNFDIVKFLEDCLDFNPAVLGTDAVEGGCLRALKIIPILGENDKRLEITDIASVSDIESISFNNSNANAQNYIDQVLLTGRRCWTFGQGDWQCRRGCSELLIPTKTCVNETTPTHLISELPNPIKRNMIEYECLKAYRTGNFFARYVGKDNSGNVSPLSITNIDFTTNKSGNMITSYTYTITAENADGICIIVDGEKETFLASNGESSITATKTIDPSAIYVRAFAYMNVESDFKPNNTTWPYYTIGDYLNYIANGKTAVQNSICDYLKANNIFDEGQTNLFANKTNDEIKSYILDTYKDIVVANPIMIHPKTSYTFNPTYGQ